MGIKGATAKKSGTAKKSLRQAFFGDFRTTMPPSPQDTDTCKDCTSYRFTNRYCNIKKKQVAAWDCCADFNPRKTCKGWH